eukprot:m.50617 g.50617  ORF g.50617 m.50617 type:complete len:325 (+) comp10896_c0_seq1:13-987(+)
MSLLFRQSHLLQSVSASVGGLWQRCLATAAPTATAAQKITRVSVIPTFLTQEQVDCFQRDGFLVIDRFSSGEECDKLESACNELISQYDPAKDFTTTFSTTEQKANDYFLTSGDKIRYFFEEGAVDEKGNIIVDIDRAFNKLGHALHWQIDAFKQFTFNEKIRGIAHDIGFVQPVVPQSMFIFKQPGIGGEVVPHQDSSFLHTTPLSCTGFWTPLEDCTLENGCLQAIPGSHLNGIHNNRRMIRNSTDTDVEFTAEPIEYNDEDFVPLEIPRGSLVLIHGEVVHKSSPNTSGQSRHAYVFHMVDGTAHYDNKNWLQTDTPFPQL